MWLLPGRGLGRSLGVLLSGIMLFHAGWYLLLPYLAVLFTTRRGLSAAEAGFVLAAQSLALLIGSLAGSMLADRLGLKRMLLAGLALRSLGIATLGLSGSMGFYLAASAVAGFGGGLYVPAAKAAIARIAGEGQRTAVFALRGVAANVGVSLGPIAGALLVRGSMPRLFGVAAAVHAILGVATWILLERPERKQETAPTGFRDLLRDSPYLVFTAVTGLMWALFAQLAISMPLFASRVLGLEASIGLLWTISSATVILLQVAVTRHLLTRLAPLTALMVGTCLVAGGLGLVGMARGFGGLALAILVFVAGEMLLMPTSDATVSRLARPGAEGAYFGVASLAWGLGEGLGNLGGGGLMQFSLRTGRIGLPWMTYAAVGLGVAMLYGALAAWAPLRKRLKRPDAVSDAPSASVKRHNRVE